MDKYEIMKSITELNEKDRDEIFFWLGDYCIQQTDKNFNKTINKIQKLI